MATITLSSKAYTFIVTKRFRREVEDATGVGLRTAMFDGKQSSLAAILWAGCKGQEKGRPTLLQMTEALENADEEYDRDLRGCLKAIFDAHPFGRKLSDLEMSRIFSEDDDEGKEPPTAS